MFGIALTHCVNACSMHGCCAGCIHSCCMHGHHIARCVMNHCCR